MRSETFDAVVIGARCAGASVAMLMAKQGMSVLCVDRDEAGTDTLSSHAMTRGAVMQLERWGVAQRLMAHDTPWIGQSTFHFGDEVIPVDLRPMNGVPGMMGTRRTITDRQLAEAAAEAGAELRYRCAFRDVLRDGSGRVTGVILSDPLGRTYNVSAGLVVGADGLRSTVARRLGAPVTRQGTNALTHIYAYVRGMPLADNHAFFAKGLSVGVLPTNGGQSCVIASVRPESFRELRATMTDTEALRHLASETNAELGVMMNDAEIVGVPKVFGGHVGRMHQAAGPGWALLGDAGYFRDPVTAHGMTDAFRDAEVLARAAASGTDQALKDFAAARDAVTKDIWTLTDRLAAFDMPVTEVRDLFLRLSAAMRDEQAWMQDRFSLKAIAA